MALSNNSKGGGKPYVFISPRAKNAAGEKISPRFEISRTVDGVITPTEETATQVTGNLTGIGFKLRENRKTKAMVPHVILYITDADEGATDIYYLDLTYTMKSRSLFNGILALPDLNNIEISYYENKKGYDTFGLRLAGQRTDWKYKLNELPQPIKVMLRGVQESDFSEVDAFYEAELRAFAEANGILVEGKKQDDTAAEEQTPPEPAVIPPTAAVKPLARPAGLPAKAAPVTAATPARKPVTVAKAAVKAAPVAPNDGSEIPF